jgi:2'-5' RNA ligase
MASLIIVALPRKDDYVNKISSEKVPHMTLLFLGDDVSKVKNLSKIIDFVEHAANTSLRRFSLDVIRREELGPDKADVLTFSKHKWSGFEAINNYRSYLLKEPNIKTAYDSTEQFPEWIPHLTLGYPETPAKSDERDYPGINYVEFDRIAVWFKENEGIEFELKVYDAYEDVAMSDFGKNQVAEILEHVGIKGMKWGVRKERSASSVTVKDRGKKLRISGGKGLPAHPDALRAHRIGQVVKKSGSKAVSNEELQIFANRLQVEQNVSRLTNSNKSAGLKVSSLILKQAGNKAIQEITGGAMSQVKKTLSKRFMMS